MLLAISGFILGWWGSEEESKLIRAIITISITLSVIVGGAILTPYTIENTKYEYYEIEELISDNCIKYEDSLHTFEKHVVTFVKNDGGPNTLTLVINESKPSKWTGLVFSPLSPYLTPITEVKEVIIHT